MSPSGIRRLDIADLVARVRSMYEQVALNPHREFHFETGRALAERLGYPAADLDAIPGAAVDSFAGVGYVLDLAAIQAGETVLDLGSGSGTGSFLAANATGPAGRVIGVDMTAAQLDKAPVVFEAAAALRPGGRLAIADIVSAFGLPDGVTCDASLWAACIGGAAQRDNYLDTIRAAGFSIDTIRDNDQYRFRSDRAIGATTTYGVSSISILATRR
jgi:SAM-dependent methyltransferase